MRPQEALELNPLPGTAPMSLMPKSAAAAGVNYPTLCERIALGAL
jgi:D-alanine-D-alanine ligase